MFLHLCETVTRIGLVHDTIMWTYWVACQLRRDMLNLLDVINLTVRPLSHFPFLHFLVRQF